MYYCGTVNLIPTPYITYDTRFFSQNETLHHYSQILIVFWIHFEDFWKLENFRCSISLYVVHWQCPLNCGTSELCQPIPSPATNDLSSEPPEDRSLDRAVAINS